MLFFMTVFQKYLATKYCVQIIFLTKIYSQAKYPRWTAMDLIRHTYITGNYNRSVSIIELAAHITYVACVNLILYISVGDLQFKGNSDRQIFWETFQDNFIYSQREIRWEEITEEILFCILFWWLAWVSNSGFTSNKPHTTY